MFTDSARIEPVFRVGQHIGVVYRSVAEWQPGLYLFDWVRRSSHHPWGSGDDNKSHRLVCGAGQYRHRKLLFNRHRSHGARPRDELRLESLLQQPRWIEWVAWRAMESQLHRLAHLGPCLRNGEHQGVIGRDAQLRPPAAPDMSAQPPVASTR